MPAVSIVYSLGHVARKLGVSQNILFKIATDMDPEEGCLWVVDTARDIVAFTDEGLENVELILKEHHNWDPKTRPDPSPYGARADSK